MPLTHGLNSQYEHWLDIRLVGDKQSGKVRGRLVGMLSSSSQHSFIQEALLDHCIATAINREDWIMAAQERQEHVKLEVR